MGWVGGEGVGMVEIGRGGRVGIGMKRRRDRGRVGVK